MPQSSSRREFVRAFLAGGLAVRGLTLPAAIPRGADTGSVAPSHPIENAFPGFAALTPAEKVRRVEEVMSAARSHPSGIFICMPKVAPEGLRQVRISDFAGMDQFSENFGLKFKSITDFFDNENSITTSGSHLAAQSIRFQGSGDRAALAAARKAYASLRSVFEFGVQHGRPGFMGKPYHFEYSSHTTGDQFLHTLWGLWTFYPVAAPDEQAEIRRTIKAMADHMIAADFSVHFEDGRSSNMRLDPTDYNAIMAALVAAAFRMTGEQKYRDSFEYVMRTGRWRTHRRLDLIIEKIKDGTWQTPRWEFLVGSNKQPGEFAHWEQIQHCQFIAIAASIIHESVPDLFPAEELRRVLGLWWEDYVMGFDRKVWGYLYWFLVSAQDRRWRPCPRTERVPREQWYGGHPMLSFASSWIYGDCLARFLWTALVVARHCPQLKEEAAGFAAETFRRLQPWHLLWIADPDGKQIPPELRYFTEFLSSEVPENVVASYWEGRRLKLWN